jgi:hypothetical protein
MGNLGSANINFTNNCSIENVSVGLFVNANGTNVIFSPTNTEFRKTILTYHAIDFNGQCHIIYSNNEMRFDLFDTNRKFTFNSAYTNIIGLQTVFEIYPANYIKCYELLDVDNNRIINVANATSNTDAVNLGQLNSTVGAYLPLAGGTMTGNIDMGTSNIIVDTIQGQTPNNQISLQATNIYSYGIFNVDNITTYNQNAVNINADCKISNTLYVNTLEPYNASTITANCNEFHISSGTSGDCKLILEADTDNNNENDTPQILFKADGGYIEGAIYLNNNTLDIVSSVSSNGGIRFLTTTTDSDYTNGNLAMTISNSNQSVSVANNLNCGTFGSNGDVEILGDIDFSANRTMDFGYGATARGTITEGKITYSTTIAPQYSLNIYGGLDAVAQGNGNNRLTQLYGDLLISDDLTVSGYIQANGSQIVNISSFKYYAYSGYGGIASGNIGIGVYSPNARMVATEFDATSDRRCKENVNNVSDDTVNRFMNLQAKSYNWKRDESKKFYYGFIAQDVIYESKNDETKELDDLACIVNFHDASDMKGGIDEETGVNNPEGKCMNLNYDSCIPLLHRALQIEKQKNEILSEQILTLENRILQIENILNNNNIVN